MLKRIRRGRDVLRRGILRALQKPDADWTDCSTIVYLEPTRHDGALSLPAEPGRRSPRRKKATIGVLFSQCHGSITRLSGASPLPSTPGKSTALTEMKVIAWSKESAVASTSKRASGKESHNNGALKRGRVEENKPGRYTCPHVYTITQSGVDRESAALFLNLAIRPKLPERAPSSSAASVSPHNCIIERSSERSE